MSDIQVGDLVKWSGKKNSSIPYGTLGIVKKMISESLQVEWLDTDDPLFEDGWWYSRKGVILVKKEPAE